MSRKNMKPNSNCLMNESRDNNIIKNQLINNNILIENQDQINEVIEPTIAEQENRIEQNQRLNILYYNTTTDQPIRNRGRIDNIK